MPRRNRNANRARRRRCTTCGVGRAMYDNGPDLAGLCDDCANLAVWGAATPAELEHDSDPATWTIPGDGFADGGTPYTAAELERRPAA